MIKSYKLRRVLSNILIYAILIVLGLIWISPLVYLVLHSFREEGLATVSYLIPKTYSLNNYIQLFKDTATLNFPRWFTNTLFVAVCSCSCNI